MKITDIYNIPREHRKIPFIISAIGLLLSWMVWGYFWPDFEFEKRILLILIMNAVVFLITLKEKVSLHLYALTLLSLLFLNESSKWAWLLICLIPFVTWSRWYLKAHNWSQLLLGFVVAGLVFGSLLFFSQFFPLIK